MRVKAADCISQQRDATNYWRYTGETQRTTVVFSDKGNTMTTHWDWLYNGQDWFVLCNYKATKIQPKALTV